MAPQGYTIHRTATGRASLVPPPPWHYVCEMLVVDYWADPDPDAVEAVLPHGLEPYPEAAGAAPCSPTGSRARVTRAELLDPARSQYKEFFIVVGALLDGEEVTTCPFIWVARDFARGLRS